MTLDSIVKHLELYKGKKIKLKIYDDIFGVYFDEFVLDDFEVKNVSVILKSGNYTHDFHKGDLLEISLVIDEEERIEMIYNAKSLEEAFEIGKTQLTPRVEEALDYVKDKFKPTPQEQTERLLSLIKSKIEFKHQNLSAESVLTHLLINTIGERKITETLKNEAFFEIHDKVDETIEKMTKEIF